MEKETARRWSLAIEPFDRQNRRTGSTLIWLEQAEKPTTPARSVGGSPAPCPHRPPPNF